MQNMKWKRTAMYIIMSFTALAVMAGTLLLLSSQRLKRQEAHLNVIETLPMETLPVETRTEDWFLGNWAGIWRWDYDELPKNTDFGIELNMPDIKACLLHVFQTETGYGAALGNTEWALTQFNDEGFSMICTIGAEYGYYPEGTYFSPFMIDEGDTMSLIYHEQLPTIVPDSNAPEQYILSGMIHKPDQQSILLLLAYLPDGTIRSGENGIIPHWYDGYEAMEGDLKGMFLLGTGSRGRRFFGAVITDPQGKERVITREDGINYGGGTYAPRDMLFEDVTEYFPIEDVPDASWPIFLRYRAEDFDYEWKDVTSQHTLYFKYEYIPRLQDEIKELQDQPQDIWTKRGILVRQGLIHYASRAADSELSDQLLASVPDLVTLEAEYLPETSLAGIHPGDTLEDARKLYNLQELTEQQAEEQGFYGVYDSPNIVNYTDGNGLVLKVFKDGRIGYVCVYKAGYDTPDGRQVGDPYDEARRYMYCRDGVVDFGDLGLDSETSVISRISIEMVLDRVWSETELDMDGDGEKERLTLSGRCKMNRLECGTRLGDYETGTVDPEDYGTKATLRVYKQGKLIDETQLPLYLYYLFPSFSDKLQEEIPGKVWIACETGGTGSEIPGYVITRTEQEWKTEYLGLFNVYN